MRKGLNLEPVVLSARPGVFVSQAQALIGFSEATTQVSRYHIYIIFKIKANRSKKMFWNSRKSLLKLCIRSVISQI